jgi:hypothetical protein
MTLPPVFAFSLQLSCSPAFSFSALHLFAVISGNCYTWQAIESKATRWKPQTANSGVTQEPLETIMPTKVESNLRIPANITKIYGELDVSPVGLLKNYALNHIHAKVQKYEAENLFYQGKHKNTFEAFKKKLRSMKNEEDSTWEDDLMDWEFAVTNLKYWKKKAQELASE